MRQESEIRGSNNLIFVTVGMHPHGFERLIKKMDEIAGNIDEEVIMQIGGTKYVPQKAKYFDFTTGEEIKELCRRARVGVTHGGVGTVLDILEQGKPIVAVPRLRKYGEVGDAHQLYFVQELEKAGKVTAVYDVNDLQEALKTVGARPAGFAKDRRLVEALKGYIARFERK